LESVICEMCFYNLVHLAVTDTRSFCCGCGDAQPMRRGEVQPSAIPSLFYYLEIEAWPHLTTRKSQIFTERGYTL